jgi:hypothetical protein
MLGFAALAEVALAEIPQLPAPTTTKVVGWGGERRRIPVERLREILKAQGSPWADELADTYQVAEKSLASSKKKKRKALEEVLEKISELAADPVDWASVNLSLQAAIQATRATLALKHIQAALDALLEDEEIILLMAMD